MDRNEARDLDAHILGVNDQTIPTYLSDGTEAELGMRVRIVNATRTYPDYRIRSIESGEVFIQKIIGDRLVYQWIEGTQLVRVHAPIKVWRTGVVHSWNPQRGDFMTELWEWQIFAPDGTRITGDVRRSLNEAIDTSLAVLAKLTVTVCANCGRPRRPDDRDYNPIDLIFRKTSVGWYSGTDGEFCGECMTRLFNRANGTKP